MEEEAEETVLVLQESLVKLKKENFVLKKDTERKDCEIIGLKNQIGGGPTTVEIKTNTGHTDEITKKEVATPMENNLYAQMALIIYMHKWQTCKGTLIS